MRPHCAARPSYGRPVPSRDGGTGLVVSAHRKISREHRRNTRMMRQCIVVNDRMQQGYVYYLTEPEGQNFDPDFRPQLTPQEMLELGVFGGKYMTDCTDEYPDEWFTHAKLCSERHDPKLNYF